MILREDEIPYAGAPAVGGLAFVGDVHLSSRRPLRRVETDWPGPVLRKLEWVVDLSRERDLLVVFLGDLFDRPHEPDESLKTAVARILSGTRLRPVVTAGNHDTGATELTDGDTLALLGEAGVLDVAARGGPVARVTVEGDRIGVGSTPHGRPVPLDVRHAFDAYGPVDRTVWTVHHDVSLGRPYPGSTPPYSVRGCDAVVMGHVHARTMGVRVGETTWHCPGSLARTSIDLEDHVPVVVTMGGGGTFDTVVVPHAADPWDRTGRVVAPSDPGSSGFVEALLARDVADMRRSGTAEGLRALARARIREDDSPAVAAMVDDLIDRAVDDADA